MRLLALFEIFDGLYVNFEKKTLFLSYFVYNIIKNNLNFNDSI